jgi:hypothetical protein
MTLNRSRKPKLTIVGDSLRWPRDTLYPLKLALTSPTSGGRSVGIVRLRTQATEFVYMALKCNITMEDMLLSECRIYVEMQSRAHKKTYFHIYSRNASNRQVRNRDLLERLIER